MSQSTRSLLLRRFWASGLHPKIETRKLGTLFIEWKGVEAVWQTPCLYQGVQGGRGAADRQRGERERLAPGVPDQTQRAVPLARCVPQGWGGGIAAVPRPAAGNPESASRNRGREKPGTDGTFQIGRASVGKEGRSRWAPHH